jgi:hypothetical protein
MKGRETATTQAFLLLQIVREYQIFIQEILDHVSDFLI